MYYPNGTFTGYDNVNGAYQYPSAVYATGQIQTPINQNALTQDEIQRLRSLRPSGMLNLQVSEDDILRACCTHCDRGQSLVQRLDDGSGDLYCPLCGARWQNLEYNKDEVRELCDKLLDAMNTVKWTGDLPTNIVREYFTMMPLINKFPDLFEYASKNMAKMLNQRGYFDAQNANIYAQYNSLFGPSYGPAGMYPQGYGYNQPAGYYNQPQPPMMPAAANVNPMQPVYGQPTPVMQPQPIQQPYNPQFQQQANMMMPQGPGINPYMPYQQQPMMAQAQPTFQPAQPQGTPVQPGQVQAQPTQPAQDPNVVTTNRKVEL